MPTIKFKAKSSSPTRTCYSMSGVDIAVVPRNNSEIAKRFKDGAAISNASKMDFGRAVLIYFGDKNGRTFRDKAKGFEKHIKTLYVSYPEMKSGIADMIKEACVDPKKFNLNMVQDDVRSTFYKATQYVSPQLRFKIFQGLQQFMPEVMESMKRQKVQIPVQQ